MLDLKNLIVSFLKTTDKRWGKNNAKKILLLPVAFSIHKGKCVVNQKMLTDVIQMLQFNNNVSGNQAPTIMGYKNEMPLDCTLLNPIIYLSPID